VEEFLIAASRALRETRQVEDLASKAHRNDFPDGRVAAGGTV